MAAVGFDQLAGVAVPDGYLEKRKQTYWSTAYPHIQRFHIQTLFHMSLWNQERALMIVYE